MAKVDLEKMRRATLRPHDKVLEGTLIVFQIVAMLLLSFKDGEFDSQALMLTAAIPVVTLIVLRGFTALWPVDRVLLTLVMFLCSVSVITLSAIARSPSTPITQAVYICIGLVAMMIGIVFIRAFKAWRKWMVPLMLLSLALVALPIIMGSEVNGAKNWILIKAGGRTIFSIQPSEVVKVALVVSLASCFEDRQNRLKSWCGVAFAAILCVVLLGQKDLGALVLYFLTTMLLYWMATNDLIVTLLGFGAGVGGAVGAYQMFEYLRTRIAVWRNPWIDPEGAGYQLIQASIAIGSGGWTGMGLGLGFPRDIPLYSSDFIYSAICEEFGLIFALMLLGVYAVIVMRSISIGMNSKKRFYALVTFGISIMMGLQTLLIVGGNIRLIPLTGVVLPFVAEGGSAMISCMAAMGLVLGISSINAEAADKDLEKAQLQGGVEIK